MIPKDKAKAKKYADDICTLLSEICKKINNKLKVSAEYDDCICKPSFRNNASAFNRIKKYKDAKSLFSYLRVTGKRTNRKYDLTAVRFFFDKNGLNCILKCFQIEIWDEELGIKNYPKTSADSAYGVERIKTRVYYNFDADIDENKKEESYDKIADKFLMFVKEQEEGDQTK